MAEPGELLDRLGVRWEQSTSPTYGYSGTFTPAGALGHWTASARGSDVATDVLEARSYHACTARSGIVHLGGYKVRQGHGGEGRTAPQRLSRDGAMTLEKLQSWQSDTSGDDTSSGANQYFYGVCIDNDGVGEVPSEEQYEAFTSSLAVFLVLAGATTVGSLLDHAASTNRKIDLATSAPLAPSKWWPAVEQKLSQLLGSAGEDLDMPMYQYVQEDEGHHLLLSDGMHIRWCRTQWDNDNVQSWLQRYGLPTEPLQVSRDSIRLGEFGVFIGEKPPW